MGKMCEADACVRNRRAASRDQQRMDLLQEQLEDLERRFQKQKVQLQNAESALERRQIEAANLPSTVSHTSTTQHQTTHTSTKQRLTTHTSTTQRLTTHTSTTQLSGPKKEEYEGEEERCRG